MKRFRFEILVAMATASCGVKYDMVTSAPIATARPSTCDFRVLSLPPGPGEYDEVAILTPSHGRALAPDEFKEAVRDQVCQVGGDAVVAEINDKGHYMRGTVLRKHAHAGGEAAPSAVPSPTGDAAAAPAPPAPQPVH